MIHPTKPMESLFPGHYAVIDPEFLKNLEYGNYVLVDLGENDFRIRQYLLHDGKKPFLKAFDPKIPTYKLHSMDETASGSIRAEVYLQGHKKIILFIGVIISTYMRRIDLSERNKLINEIGNH